MSFNVIEASKRIVGQYKRYLRTSFDILDPEYKAMFNEQLERDTSISKGPYLEVIDSFEKSSNVESLIQEGVLSKDFRLIDDIYSKPSLYSHQVKAVRKALSGKNVVVSTGTGSGKTECFLIPIIESMMREKREKGKIGPGVRALLIYPMNALANDQVDRLRKSLAKYPDITFGCYTGQTENRTSAALNIYGRLNRDKNGNAAKPLPNELISREQMKDSPPNILITNYAMLEYLMLRPGDNIFFDGEYAGFWKYIVLDEAHTYTGSTGIEVSMLLRRVLAKLKNPSVQFILTSATLGGEDSAEDIVKFAENLCGVPFSKNDVVKADRISLSRVRQDFDLGIDFYSELGENMEAGYPDDNVALSVLNMLASKYGYIVKDTYDGLSELLYAMLLKDRTFWRVKDYLSEPKTVSAVCSHMGWTTPQLTSFVRVASYAVKDSTKLFDARYHMFIRATEGAFITLPPYKSLSLEGKKKEIHDGKEYAVFETVTCSQCHAMYILGQISGSTLIQKSAYGADGIPEAFMIGEAASDEDSDSQLKDENLKTAEFELCPYCGFIRRTDLVHKTHCSHNPSEYVKLVQVATSEKTGRVTKCICCEGTDNLGILRPFFSGQEASTSVIGTALFEELPEYSEDKQASINLSQSYTSSKTAYDGIDDGFDASFDDGFDAAMGTPSSGTGDAAKQFLCFSDNRQAAAYFACYFSETYDDLLYGKMLNDKVRTSGEGKPMPRLAAELASKFKDNGIAPFSDSKPDYEAEAWKAVLKALVDNKQRNSLIGLGLIGIGVTDNVKFSGHTIYHLSEAEMRDICLAMTMGMLSDNAIWYDKDLTDQDKEFFTHNGSEKTYLLEGSNARSAVAFLPRSNKTNKRVDYVKRIFDAKGNSCTDEQLKNFMEAVWKRFFAPVNDDRLLKNVSSKGGADGFKVNIDNLYFTKKQKWYCCSKCHRFTPYNVAGVCPSYRCDGTLDPVDVEQSNKDNHYFRLYNDLEAMPLRVVEHTAQLSREEAYKYQNMFKEKKIDVLSCSTTFEMGVDIGNLETVFMRNVPPSPSNYTQRAGRAGRTSKSAAFALTFCNKSNHDFTYFNSPDGMINGTIKPPVFKVDNEKICIRHVYASALSFFWKEHSEYFKFAAEMMEDGIVSPSVPSGYDAFKVYLESKPQELKRYLKTWVPFDLQSEFDIDDFGWVKWLFDEPCSNYPNFKAVHELYNEEVGTLLEDKRKLDEQGKQTDFITTRLNTYKREYIITFLSKYSILPKYGFPVDTVQLSVNMNSKEKRGGLDLNRDLSMAIAEYAPGSQIIANGKMLTSRYVRKVPSEHWKMYDYVVCPECKTMNMDIHTDAINSNPLKECRQCGYIFRDVEKKTFLIPDFGFIAEPKITKPTLVKPERSYRTEPFFVNYTKDIPEHDFNVCGVTVHSTIVSNGPMAILAAEDFFVCQSCGYALNAYEARGIVAGPFVKYASKEHKTATGKACKGRLERFSIGYRFETDVIKIRMDTPCSYDEAYSVLQALILAACDILDIDDNEISGCIQAEDINCSMYSFVLYDVTPGGAGHVKRLDNEEAMESLLRRAYARADRCTCGGPDGDMSCYACLRTYHNQRHHDIIKRRYVTAYLGFARDLS